MAASEFFGRCCAADVAEVGICEQPFERHDPPNHTLLVRVSLDRFEIFTVCRREPISPRVFAEDTFLFLDCGAHENQRDMSPAA